MRLLRLPYVNSGAAVFSVLVLPISYDEFLPLREVAHGTAAIPIQRKRRGTGLQRRGDRVHFRHDR